MMVRLLCVAAFSAILVTGCEPPGPTVRKKVVQRPSLGGGSPAGTVDPAQATESGAPGEAAAGTPAAANPPVRLSTGTVLPQTGPEGPIVLFSVDYELKGELAAGQVVWIVTRAQGSPAEMPVELKPQGTLQGGQSWAADDGPFEAWIEVRSTEGMRTEVSNRVPLQ